MAGESFVGGLLGWPLLSSLSPLLHADFMAQAGISGGYSLYPVEPSSVATALFVLREYGLDGLNVTIPLKTTVLARCSGMDGTALSVGAANTLVRSGQGWFARNTDPEGFGMALERHGLEPPFAVVGLGGVGRSVCIELDRRGLPWTAFSSTGRHGGNIRPLEGMGRFLSSAECRTVVNATPLGRDGSDLFPLEPGLIRGRAFFDLNYNPGWSWRNTLAAAGVSVFTGEVMLACQAAASFRIWTGFAPDPDGALSRALAVRGRTEGSG